MTADAEDDDTRIVPRRVPRQEPPLGAEQGLEAAPKPDTQAPDTHVSDEDRTVIVARRPIDDHTLIVERRPVDEHTRVVPRRNRSADSVPTSPPMDTDPAVRPVRRADTSDTQLSGRRAALPARGLPVDDNARRHEPPQVRSGSTVRYPARPTPAMVPRRVSVNSLPPVAVDPGRIALAAAAEDIRRQTLAQARRRRRFTLVAIVVCSGGVLGAAALANW